MIYTKYFYGFEKEGASQIWTEKKVTGSMFNYTYPVDEKMFMDKINLALNHPIESGAYLMPKSQRVVDQEAKQK